MAASNDDLLISVSTDLTTVKRQLRQLGQDIKSATSGIEKQFDAVGRSVDKSMTTALQARINDMVGIGRKGAKEWQGVLAEQGKELEKLRARFNPIYATVKRYQATVVEVQQAHRLGALSANEMTAAIQRERRAALESIAAIKQRNAALADTPSTRGGAFDSANIAAQFQDIAVTSAMGQSPLTIALQQGTQLSAVLNTMGGAKGVIAGIGTALASIVNPVSLVTIGLVGATAAAAQYFSTMFSGSEETEKSVQEQAAVIQTVAARWGSAIPALREYADELERTQRLAEDTAARNATISKEFGEANSAVDRFLALVSEADFSAFNEGAMRMVDDIGKLQFAGAELESAIKAGEDATDEFARVQQLLSGIVNSSAIPATGGLREAVADLGRMYLEAARAAGVAASQFDAASGASGKRGRLNPDALSDQDFNARFGQPYAQNWEQLFPELFRKTSGARGAGGGSSGLSDLESQKSAIDDVISSLQFEQEQLGRTGTEQRIYNELKRAGVDINSAAGQQIANLVTQVEAERQAMESSKRALEQRNEAIGNLFEMGEDALLAMMDNGQKAEDAIKRLAVQLALAAAQAALLGTGPLAGLFGGGGGLGSFFGGGGSIFSNDILAGSAVGLFAKGGVTNKPAIFGEAGPEAAVPLPDGRRIPVDLRMPKLAAPASVASSRTPVDININVAGARGNQEIMQMVGEGVRHGLDQFSRQTLPVRVREIRQDPRKLG